MTKFEGAGVMPMPDGTPGCILPVAPLPSVASALEHLGGIISDPAPPYVEALQSPPAASPGLIVDPVDDGGLADCGGYAGPGCDPFGGPHHVAPDAAFGEHTNPGHVDDCAVGPCHPTGPDTF
jgi:hypothetical protein